MSKQKVLLIFHSFYISMLLNGVVGSYDINIVEVGYITNSR